MDASLAGKRILITGVGIKPVDFVFRDIVTGDPSHTPVIVDAKEYKANIGTAVALECAKAGAAVHLVARTEEKLQKVKKWIEASVAGAIVDFSAIDLNNVSALEDMVASLPKDLPLYFVQSVGLGAGTVKIPNDNPYLRIEDLSEELIDAELTVLRNTITLLKTLLPRFRKQDETRVCIISSMSAVRSVISGSMHMAAKGAISRFTNAAMIELDAENIFITDVRPGIVDTGMYDSRIVQSTVSSMGARYGADYTTTNIRCMPPSAVGKVVAQVLASDAHITSVNMVARGQWPHEGS